MAKVSTSAHEAKELKLLRENDLIIFNAFELLHVAKNRSRPWPNPATARRCPRAPSAWPATSASPPSR
jgi:hypothetical protein